MDIRTPRDGQITLDDSKEFVESYSADAGKRKATAYKITGPDNYVIGVDPGTPIAPELRDADGNKLDGSTRITVQKCDKQGNPIGSGIVFSETLSRFNYEFFRNDPDFFRKIKNGFMIDEYEIVKIFVDIPAGSPPMSADKSSLTIGDNTSDFGKPVEIVNHDDLTGAESQAVKMAAQGGN